MALSNIPVLSTDYALFDWNDWPDSFAALVSGGLTSEFEKECWNAIVNKLAEALEDGGLSWDSKYTTAENALITEEYGDLYAAAINSIRHNIDHPVPLGWKWAKDSSFRGYVGREDFKGVDAYGEDGADDVYPEYIIELVRKLNLLIGIMTGEKAVCLNGQELSATQLQSVFRAGESAPVQSEEVSQTLGTASVRAAQSAPVAAEAVSDTRAKAKAEKLKAATARLKDELFHTDYTAQLRKGRMGLVVPETTLLTTKSRLTLDLMNAIYVVGRALSTTQHEAALMAAIAVQTAAESASNTKAQGTARTGMATHTEAASKSASRNNVVITGGQSCPVEHRGTSNSKCRVILGHVITASVKSEAKSDTACAVTLSTAWLPPVWVDGGLWIRQAYEITQNDDGSLEVR